MQNKSKVSTQQVKQNTNSYHLAAASLMELLEQLDLFCVYIFMIDWES